MIRLSTTDPGTPRRFADDDYSGRYEAELADRIAAAERGEVIEYTDFDQMIRDLCR